MGIVLVAFLAARVSLAPGVTMTSTLRRTSSSASAGSRSYFVFGISKLKSYVLTFDVAEFAELCARTTHANSMNVPAPEPELRKPIFGSLRRLLRLGEKHGARSRAQSRTWRAECWS